MKLPYEKPLIGLLSGWFWYDVSKVARLAFQEATTGLSAAIDRTDLLVDQVGDEELDSLYAHRMTLTDDALPYLRGIQFCQRYGQLESFAGILVKDVCGILHLPHPDRHTRNLPDRVIWLERNLTGFIRPSIFAEEPPIREIRNALMHDGAILAEHQNEDRHTIVVGYHVEHPTLLIREHDQIHLTNEGSEYFERWFTEIFYAIHDSAVTALNNMTWPRQPHEIPIGELLNPP